MAILLRVQWVDQSDHPEPYQRIRRIGGVSRDLQWKYTQQEAIESIERGLCAYYVKKGSLAVRLVVGRTADGRKYLTVPDERRHVQLLHGMPGFPKAEPVVAAS